VGGRVVNVRRGGFFVQFDPGIELDALRSAVEFVTEIGVTPPPFRTIEGPPPVPEDAFDEAGEPEWEDQQDGELDVPADFSVEAESFLLAGRDAHRGPLKPAWDLVDLGSDVPLHKQVRDLSVADRLRLARYATKPVRELLIRDVEKRIHVEIVKNPKVKLDEIAEYSAMPGISPLALRWIARQKRYGRVRAIVTNLVVNPSTPTDVALHLLGALTPQELQRVANSPKVRENIQRAARKKLTGAGSPP